MSYLIGTSNWDPSGESIWSIAVKLARRNHMIKRDVDQVLSQWKHGFQSDLIDAAQGDRFSNERISQYTGWDSSAVNASFRDFYRPGWLEGARDEYTDIPIATDLRLCPRCIEAGQHLFIHQVQAFSKCPIHHMALSASCPHCGQGNTFFFSGSPYTWILCAHCKLPLLPINQSGKNEANARRRFIREYSDWMSQLTSAFGYDNNRFYWLRGPESYFHLAFAHRLVPGPCWMDDCFTYNDRVTHNVYTLTNFTCRLPNKDLIFTINNIEGRFATKSIMRHQSIEFDDELARERMQALRGDGPTNARQRWILDIQMRVRSMAATLYDKFNHKEIIPAINDWTFNQCYAQYGPDCSIWSNAYWLWRMCMDAAFPRGERWERTRRFPAFSEAFPWHLWQHGPGILLWSSKKDCNRYWNTGLVNSVTDIWFPQTYLDCYFLFLGIACPHVRWEQLPARELHLMLEVVGEMPGWVLEICEDRLLLHHLTIIAEPAAFLKLRSTGYRGLDAVAAKDPMALMPLARLLNVLPWKESGSQGIHWSSSDEMLAPRLPSFYKFS